MVFRKKKKHILDNVEEWKDLKEEMKEEIVRQHDPLFYDNTLKHLTN